MKEKYFNILESFKYDLEPDGFKWDYNRMQENAQDDFNDLSDEEVLELFHTFKKIQQSHSSEWDYNLNDFDVFFYWSEKKAFSLFDEYYKYFWDLYINNKMKWSEDLHIWNLISWIKNFSKNVSPDYKFFLRKLKLDLFKITEPYVKEEVTKYINTFEKSEKIQTKKED